MGNILPQAKVKLIVGFIFNSEDALRKAESLLIKKFGPIDLKSKMLDFEYTDYYNKEFGSGLKKSFISIERLISPEEIYRVKLATNQVEDSLSRGGRRTINIDPGYITLGKLVLLTTKDHTHRVYLRKGIFAESTLRFRNNTFRAWETTYPDYRSDKYISLFNEIRNIYKNQLERDKS
ncbi:MAG: DUF4416 family protein [Candidatus Omnitrophica bacterium]|nr:DUF4416 family protein [Candidatus Omnitrophota bacterium]